MKGVGTVSSTSAGIPSTIMKTTLGSPRSMTIRSVVLQPIRVKTSTASTPGETGLERSEAILITSPVAGIVVVKV
jgi:hypothetical protein